MYIGKTRCRLGTRLKEHKDTYMHMCMKCLTNKTAIDVDEHAWMNDHPINWARTKILQHVSRTMQLHVVLKEALTRSIHATPEGAHFNRDRGYQPPEGWG